MSLASIVHSISRRCARARVVPIALGAALSMMPAHGDAQVVPAPRPIPARPDTSRARGDTTTRAPQPPADTGRATRAAADSARARGARRTRAAVAPRPGIRPPISPKRAFISSLLVPGLGQSRLQRPTAGAVFAAIELAGITLARKASADLREAKALRTDSIPLYYPIDSLGRALPLTGVRRTAALYGPELARARRLHLEDWLALLAFNHLFAGAEAYVSANLWDLPAQISARPSRDGAVLAVTVTW